MCHADVSAFFFRSVLLLLQIFFFVLLGDRGAIAAAAGAPGLPHSGRRPLLEAPGESTSLVVVAGAIGIGAFWPSKMKRRSPFSLISPTADGQQGPPRHPHAALVETEWRACVRARRPLLAASLCCCLLHTLSACVGREWRARDPFRGLQIRMLLRREYHGRQLRLCTTASRLHQRYFPWYSLSAYSQRRKTTLLTASLHMTSILPRL